MKGITVVNMLRILVMLVSMLVIGTAKAVAQTGTNAPATTTELRLPNGETINFYRGDVAEKVLKVLNWTNTIVLSSGRSVEVTNFYWWSTSSTNVTLNAFIGSSPMLDNGREYFGAVQKIPPSQGGGFRVHYASLEAINSGVLAGVDWITLRADCPECASTFVSAPPPPAPVQERVVYVQAPVQERVVYVQSPQPVLWPQQPAICPPPVFFPQTFCPPMFNGGLNWGGGCWPQQIHPGNFGRFNAFGNAGCFSSVPGGGNFVGMPGGGGRWGCR